MDQNNGKRRRVESGTAVGDVVMGSSESSNEALVSQPLFTTQTLRVDDDSQDSYASPPSSPISMDLDIEILSGVTRDTQDRPESSRESGKESTRETTTERVQTSNSQAATQPKTRVCGVCRQSIVAFDDTKWIICDNKCGVDYHVTCVGLNQRVRLMLLRTDSVKWFCHFCVDNHSKKKNRLIGII